MSLEQASFDVQRRTTVTRGAIARRRRFVRTVTGRGLILIVVTLGALIILAPVLWMLSTSVKTLPQVLVFPPQWIPSALHWENYRTALTFLPFLTYARNSALVTGAILIGDVLTNSFVAYGFARLRGPGRNWLFILVLSTMMVPYPVLMIPQYVLFKNLGWIDTFLPLIVPAWFGSAFLIFLLRQFYLTIPRELDDAAEIDGCSYFGIWRRIMLPLAKPALATVAIFSFTYNWNDYLAPLIYLNSENNYTLPLGLASLMAALRDGRLRGAGLDVFEHEPLPLDSPLLALDNVWLAPHALAWTDDVVLGNSTEDARGLVRLSRGEIPDNVVNKEVLDRPGFQARLRAIRERL